MANFTQRHGLSLGMSVRTLLIMAVMLPHAIVRHILWKLFKYG
jgi:hypothetical protein